MRIQHNIMAMNAYRHYTNNVSAMKKNLEKLSSGYRINRAGDDAAGLAISEKMRAQITGLETAQKNAKNGINLVQTAEGALTEVHDMLNRMYELAEQSANGTYDNETDRVQLQKEVNSLREEIDRISKASNFNGINLLDGTLGMNTKAFSTADVSGNVALGIDGFVTNIPSVGTIAGTDTILHSNSSDAVIGEFTLDFGQTSIEKGTGTTSFDLNILGTTFTINDTASNSLDGDAIAALVAKQFEGDGSGGMGTAANKLLQIKNDGTIAATGAAGNQGSIFMVATANGSKVTFKTVGYGDGAGGTLTSIGANQAAWNTNMAKVDPAALINFNDLKAVSITAAAAGAAASGTPNGLLNVGYTDVKNNAAQQAGAFGNTKLTLKMDEIKDGDILEIAGEKYQFAIGKDSTYKKPSDPHVIDLTDIVSDATDLSGTLTAQQQTAIMAAITDAAGDNPHVTVGNSSGAGGAGATSEWGKLDIVEKVNHGASEANQTYKDMMSDLDSFKTIVALKRPSDLNGTKITNTSPSDIKDGDALNIDGTTYMFTADGTGSDSNVQYVKTADGMAGLSDKLTLNHVTNEYDAATKTVTVYSAAGQSAPTVGGSGLTLQIGDTADDFNQLSVSVKSCNAKGMGIDGIDISTQAGAQAALSVIKNAVNYISDVRGDLGATQNRLDHTINNLAAMTENIQDAESTIRDVDIAEEMMAYTKNNILIQSAQAMLAQANQVPQGVLQLLQ